MKKFTQQEICEKFRSKGYELLDVYKDALTPVLVKCPEGHETLMRYNSFKKSNCSICVGNVKFTQKEATEQAISLGYTMLEEYKTANTPTLMRCVNGHETKLKLSKLKIGNGCRKCSNEKRRLKKEYVINFLAKENYVLLGEYKNHGTPMHIRCPMGHEVLMRFGNFNYGFRCKICSNTGFDESKPSFVYLTGNHFRQKIGIMNENTDRIKKHEKNFGLILIEKIYFQNGSDAYALEQKILKKLEDKNIKLGKKAFDEKFDGYTESWLLTDLEVTKIEELINL